MSLGRVCVGFLVATCALGAVGAFGHTYGVQVVASLLAGLTFFAALACGVLYAATAFFGMDPELARYRRTVLQRAAGVAAVAVLALLIWTISQAIANAG